MNEINLSTPSLLFPAISLLMLAYTNRFVVLSSLVRKLHEAHQSEPNPVFRQEIEGLRRRIHLIRGMQCTGISSMLCCVVCMLVLLAGLKGTATLLLVLSLILLGVSLAQALAEILQSTHALELHISDLDKPGADE